MAKSKRAPKTTAAAPVTPERAGRLYRLLRLLGRKPQTRDGLGKTLKLGVRGFYRDLEALRLADIDVLLKDGCYLLVGKLDRALSRLPFPDPGLTLGEATELARGRSKAHRKLQRQVHEITKR
jgi:predicted DNA-binding transcriptional regulator YafY